MKKINLILISLFLIFFHIILVPIVSFIIINEYNLENTIWEQVVFLISFILLGVTIFITYKKSLLIDLKAFKKEYFFKAFKYLLLMTITLNVLGLISQRFGVEISENEQSIRDLIYNFPIIRSFLSVMIIPFIEEMIYRFSIRKFINNNFIFILVSAFIFGFLHVPNFFVSWGIFFQFLAYASSGIYLAYFYLKTNNIWSAVFLHFVNNALGVILLLLV